nr:hypothetical protein Iba_chr12eCG7990 [Ipomoea batatas]
MVISHPSSQVVSFPSLFPRQCSSGVGRWRSWRKLPVDAPVSPPRSNGNAMGGGGMSATISSKADTATTVEDSGRRLPFPASPFSCNGEAALGGELGVVWQSSEQQLWTSIFPSPARMLKQSPLASSDDSAAASLSGEEPLIRFFSDVGRRRHRSSAMVISHPSSQVVSFPSLFPRQCSSGVGRWRSWRKLPVDAPVSPPRSNGNAMGGGGMSATISSKVE